MNASEHIARAEEELGLIFEEIDSREIRLTRKVLDAFREHGVALRHFAPSNGYGYDDTGRDTLAEVWASLFGAEAAIVRPQIASGTAALSAALFGLTLPGDHIVSATGAPYDTLQSVIGTDPETGQPYEPMEFEVSGEKIQAVHMLPGYTHNIINLSETEDLVTLMWANEIFDPSHPDTYYEPV